LQSHIGRNERNESGLRAYNYIGRLGNPPFELWF
jgi:hypothetical protein